MSFAGATVTTRLTGAIARLWSSRSLNEIPLKAAAVALPLMEERATVGNGVVGSVFRFCLLGRVSVSRDGMEVPVRAGKQRALLVGLLLDGDMLF
jgi:hypothetical protein